MILEFVEFRGDHVDDEAQRAQFVRDEILRLLLVAGKAGELHEFLQEDNQFTTQRIDAASRCWLRDRRC